MSLPAWTKALEYLPATGVLKFLEKKDPRYKNYFASVLANGLDINRALNFVTDKISSRPSQEFKGQLEQRGQQGVLRPDEMVAREQLRSSELPTKIAGSALSFGIPALANMQDSEEGEDGQTGGIPPPIPNKFTDPFQILHQHDPSLASFLQNQTQKSGPVQAAAIAKNHSSYKNSVNKFEKMIGQNFVDWFENALKGQPPRPPQSGQSEMLAGVRSQGNASQLQGQAANQTPDTQALLQAIQAYKASRKR